MAVLPCNMRIFSFLEFLLFCLELGGMLEYGMVVCEFVIGGGISSRMRYRRRMPINTALTPSNGLSLPLSDMTYAHIVFYYSTTSATMSTAHHVRRLGSLHPGGCLLRSRVMPTTSTLALKQVRVYVSQQKSTLHSEDVGVTPPKKPGLLLSERAFWTCRGTWRRAGVNTLRCLVGCTVGDFSALWILQTYAPNLGMSTIMALSSEWYTRLPLVFFRLATTVVL